MNRAARRRRAREIGKGLGRKARKAIAEKLKPQAQVAESIPGRKILTLPWGLHVVKYDEPR
jgi:hypothetical protein